MKETRRARRPQRREMHSAIQKETLVELEGSFKTAISRAPAVDAVLATVDKSAALKSCGKKIHAEVETLGAALETYAPALGRLRPLVREF